MLVADNRERGGGGHNWEKCFIGLLQVSEHLGHFKAKKHHEKKREIVWFGGTPPLFGKKTNYFPFFCLKASLTSTSFQ